MSIYKLLHIKLLQLYTIQHFSVTNTCMYLNLCININVVILARKEHTQKSVNHVSEIQETKIYCSNQL